MGRRSFSREFKLEAVRLVRERWVSVARRTIPLSRRGGARIRMPVAIYARFSSDLQDVRSITDQVALAREQATRQGWQFVGEFTDAAISGASMVNRPGLRELTRSSEERKFDVVLTENLDRLSRDLMPPCSRHFSRLPSFSRLS